MKSLLITLVLICIGTIFLAKGMIGTAVNPDIINTDNVSPNNPAAQYKTVQDCLKTELNNSLSVDPRAALGEALLNDTDIDAAKKAVEDHANSIGISDCVNTPTPQF